jgi:hypothetical protein
LALLNVARGLLGLFQSADDGGIASQMAVGEFLLVAPEQVLVPATLGIGSGIAGVAVLGGRGWSQILAIAVGVACIVVGVLLTLPAIAEWGVPGSFALLLLPAAAVAFLVGAYVLYAAVANRAYFRQ